MGLASITRGCALAAALAPFFALAVEFADHDPYAIHDAFVEQDRAAYLRLLIGEGLRLEPPSAPLGSIALLYDGSPGGLQGGGQHLLEFDGPRVELAYAVASWRHPESVAFTAVELFERAAQADLEFRAASGDAGSRIVLSRRPLERRGELALVEYAGRLPRAPAAGELRLHYEVQGLSNARLGEFMLDGLAPRKDASLPGAQIDTLDRWMKAHGNEACPAVRSRFTGLGKASARQGLNALLPPPHRNFRTQLVYWKTTANRSGGYATHSLILRVDDSGSPAVDFVRGWLVVPDARRGALPLVVLPQQGHIYAAMEPLGVLGETELGLAPELARHGVASLAFDSAIFGSNTTSFSYDFFSRYPDSGSTAKELDNLRRLLDQVLAADFQSRAGLDIDARRIGIWGFSYGAWISLLAGAVDDRIRAVAVSSFHYRDRDIAPGLSASLYIPQLACLVDRPEPPISIARILREYHKNALLIAPDAILLQEWTDGLDDRRVRVVINPLGHVVTETERAAVLDFFYRTFHVNALASVQGARHDLPSAPAGVAEYLAREARWRDLLVKAMLGR